MRTARRAILWAALLVGATAASAAPPYYPSAVNDLKDARVHRNVYVDSAGRCSTKHRCDFRDLGDALAWVAAQGPTAAARWSVAVYPGDTGFAAGGFSYSESTLTIPPYTTVYGLASPWIGGLNLTGQAWIQLTGTSGALLPVGEGSSLADLGFYASANPTAARTVLTATDGDADNSIRNVAIIDAGSGAFATTLVSVGGAYVYADGLHTQRVTGTLSRNVKVTSGALVLANSRTYPGASQPAAIEVTGGTLQIHGGKVAAGATLDLLQSGGTLQVDGLSYSTESGTITRGGALTPRVTYGNTAPAACTPPELFVDVDSSTICACTTANTWKCAAIS